MESLGQGGKYRPIIETEVSQVCLVEIGFRAHATGQLVLPFFTLPQVAIENIVMSFSDVHCGNLTKVIFKGQICHRCFLKGKTTFALS